jgi:hypothetical protein
VNAGRRLARDLAKRAAALRVRPLRKPPEPEATALEADFDGDFVAGFETDFVTDFAIDRPGFRDFAAFKRPVSGALLLAPDFVRTRMVSRLLFAPIVVGFLVAPAMVPAAFFLWAPVTLIALSEGRPRFRAAGAAFSIFLPAGRRLLLRDVFFVVCVLNVFSFLNSGKPAWHHLLWEFQRSHSATFHPTKVSQTWKFSALMMEPCQYCGASNKRICLMRPWANSNPINR